MAVLDSFIKGYQDGQARVDTLKDRALQLKQLQEEKARQAQQDAEERAKFGLQYIDQTLKDKEWWKANRKNSQAIGSMLSQKNTFEDALNLPRTAALTDVLKPLFAQKFSELQRKVASGEMTPDAADREMEAEVGADVIEEEMFNVQNSAILQGKKPEEVFKAQLKPIVPAKLRASKPPVKPVMKLSTTGDTGIDDTIQNFYMPKEDISGIKSYLQGLIPPQNAREDALFGVGFDSTDNATKQIASGTILEGAMGSHPAYKLLEELEMHENALVQFEADKKQYDADLEADRLEKERALKETELNNSILKDVLKGSTNISGRKGLRFMFASNWDKQVSDKKKAEFDKRTSSYDLNTLDGVKQQDWAYATEQGWTTKPFDEWKRNPAEDIQKSKATAKEVSDAYNRTVQLKKDIAAKVKYASTQEEAMSMVPDKDTYAIWLDENMVNESMGRPSVPYNKASYITVFGQTVNEQESTKYKYYSLQQQKTMFDTKEKIQAERYKVEDAFQNRSISNDEHNTKLRELQVMADLLEGKSKKPVAVKSYQPKFTPAIDNLSFSYKGKTVKANPEWVFAFEPGENGQRYKYPKAAEIAQSIASYLQQSATLMPDENGDLVMKPGMMQAVQDALPGASDIKPKLAQLITSLNNEVAKISAGGSTETAPTLYSPNIPSSTPVVGSDGVGRKDKFTPISADYEVYKAKNGLWYQRSKYKSGSKNTGARPAQGGGLAPGDTVITIKGPNGKPMKVIRRGKK